MKKVRVALVFILTFMFCLQAVNVKADDVSIEHDFITTLSEDGKTNKISLHIDDDNIEISRIVLPDEEVVENSKQVEYIATENKEYEFQVYYYVLNEDGSTKEDEEFELLSHSIDNLEVSEEPLVEKEVESAKASTFSEADQTYYVSATGNDENDGLQESTPKKSIVEILNNSSAGSNIKIYLIDNSAGDPAVIKIPKDLGSVYIASIDSTQKSFTKSIYANGVPTTFENLYLAQVYGGGFEEDVHGDTHLVIKGSNCRIATALSGGGEVSVQNIGVKTATVHGNTKVEILDKATTGAWISGGGYFADVTGNVDVYIDGNPNGSTPTRLYGATRVQTTKAANLVTTNTVGGNVKAVIKDGNFYEVSGNTGMLIYDSNSGQYATSNVNGSIDLTIDGGSFRNIAGNTYADLYIGNFVSTYSKIQRLDSKVGSVNLHINGGTVKYYILGGSWIENGKQVINGDVNVDVNVQTNETFKPQRFFGGDAIYNTAARYAPELLEADITGNINVDIHGGRFGNIYYGTTYAGGTHTYTQGKNGTVAVPGYGEVHGNVTLKMDDASGTKPSLDGLKTGNREEIAMTSGLSGVRTIVKGNVTTNIKNVEKVYLINGGFQENGQIFGKVTINVENVTGAGYQFNTVPYVYGTGRQNGVNGTSIKSHVDGGVEMNVKDMNVFQVAPSLLGGGVLSNKDGGNAITANLENVHITHLVTNGSNVYTQQDRELIIEGNTDIKVYGTNSMLGRVVTGSSIGKGASATINGDINIEIQDGVLTTLSMGHIGSEVASAEYTGNINVTIGKNASFKLLTPAELLQGEFEETSISTKIAPENISGKRTLTLESPQRINKLDLAQQIDVYNFIRLENEGVPTLSIDEIVTLPAPANTETSPYNATVNLAGTWQAEDIIITTPSGVTEENWFVQGWVSEQPALEYRLPGEAGGEWYLKEAYSDAVTVTFESNGGTAINDQQLTIGDHVVKPEDPQKEGYEFKGWYIEQAFEELWDYENGVVTTSMTLYAKWEQVPDQNPIDPIPDPDPTPDPIPKDKEPIVEAPNLKVNSTKPGSPSTGDTTNVFILFAGIGIAALSMIGVMVKQFKKKENS